MPRIQCSPDTAVLKIPCLLLLLALGALFLTAPAHAQFKLVKISKDSFQNAGSQHKSEVEPDSFAWGKTIVTTFQVARNYNGGGADLGFATSTDGGMTWTQGYLPGLTDNYKDGPYLAASDASVAYDAKHGQWLISSLPIGNAGTYVAVSRSTDGLHWGKPIPVDSSGEDDKNWIVCDNTPASPFYGNCYTEWDSFTVLMSTSSDGGKTWGPAKAPADQNWGIGGQPLVQPSGKVVVPIAGDAGMIVFHSTDGGTSWSQTTLVSNVASHGEAGSLRSPNLPSAEIDAAGRIYLVWSDCRFRTGCSTNDLVMSTSKNGTTWTEPVRIPIDDLSSTVDHFIPGIAVDRATKGATAHLTVAYYYYPVSNCGGSCELDVGFTTSQDGGKTWTAGQQLAGPMQLSWLPRTSSGVMVADYISASYVKGNPFAVFAVAKPPNNGLFNQAMYTTTAPLLAAGNVARFSSKGERPIPNAKSDHPYVRFHDVEKEAPLPPQQLKR